MATSVLGGHRSPTLARTGAIWRPYRGKSPRGEPGPRAVDPRWRGSGKSSLAAEKPYALLLRYQATGLVVRKFLVERPP